MKQLEGEKRREKKIQRERIYKEIERQSKSDKREREKKSREEGKKRRRKNGLFLN